jgi:hypothetical protein
VYGKINKSRLDHIRRIEKIPLRLNDRFKALLSTNLRLFPSHPHTQFIIAAGLPPDTVTVSFRRTCREMFPAACD